MDDRDWLDFPWEEVLTPYEVQFDAITGEVVQLDNSEERELCNQD